MVNARPAARSNLMGKEGLLRGIFPERSRRARIDTGLKRESNPAFFGLTPKWAVRRINARHPKSRLGLELPGWNPGREQLSPVQGYPNDASARRRNGD